MSDGVEPTTTDETIGEIDFDGDARNEALAPHQLGHPRVGQPPTHSRSASRCFAGSAFPGRAAWTVVVSTTAFAKGAPSCRAAGPAPRRRCPPGGGRGSGPPRGPRCAPPRTHTRRLGSGPRTGAGCATPRSAPPAGRRGRRRGCPSAGGRGYARRRSIAVHRVRNAPGRRPRARPRWARPRPRPGRVRWRPSRVRLARSAPLWRVCVATSPRGRRPPAPHPDCSADELHHRLAGRSGFGSDDAIGNPTGTWQVTRTTPSSSARSPRSSTASPAIPGGSRPSPPSGGSPG
jgi:hypothetical protein